MSENETYKIIRFRFHGDKRIIKRGLTLEQAQEHCQREDTHGEGWFDGYDKDTAWPNVRIADTDED